MTAVIRKASLIHNKKSRFLPYALILFVFFVSIILTYADVQNPSSHDGLIKEIRGWANRHVSYGSPMQTQLVVDLFRNNTLGMTPKEIAQIYEEEYTRLKPAEIHVQTQPSGLMGKDFGMGVVATLVFMLIFYLLRTYAVNVNQLYLA